MLTVKNFLQLAPFKTFELVAGANGLENEITGVKIFRQSRCVGLVIGRRIIDYVRLFF